LDVERYVDMPGIVENPYPAMARASLFVLSSRREGSPNVLVEALACGCPVVATDCASGPAEILAGGRFGLLAPVSDPEALASAMRLSLSKRWNADELRERARLYDSRQSALQFLDLIGIHPTLTKDLADGKRIAA
jgi:glycosyltransferase involved in cell wall biosynthesis